MALRWRSSMSRSCFSDAVWRGPPWSVRPLLSAITGRFEVEKLLRTATGSQPCSKRRWQMTCRVVHSPGASDLSRYGSIPWSCRLILAHAASDLAFSPVTVAVAIAGSSLRSSGVEYTGPRPAAMGWVKKEPRRRRRSAAPPTRIERDEPTLAQRDFVHPGSTSNHESRAGRNDGPDQPVAPTDAVPTEGRTIAR